MARIYHPGVEVFNSNTETKTLLLKNNWHLPGSHKLGWQYMRSDIRFGEINPFHSTYVLNMEEHNDTNRPKELSPQVQSIDSQIRTDTYKLGWTWKSEDNPWINLDANLWRINTRSTRHQSGGMSLATAKPDPFYDAWHWCTQRQQLPSGPLGEMYSNCTELMEAFDITGKSKEEIMQIFPNDEGQFAVLSGAQQNTRVSRTGFDIRLPKRKTGRRSRYRQQPRLVQSCRHDHRHEQTGRAARRQFDTALAEGRRRRDPRYMAGGDASIGSYRAGVYMPYWELTSAEEERDIRAVEAAWEKAWQLASTSPGTSAAGAAWMAATDLERQHKERYNHNRFLDGPHKGQFHHDTLARINQQGKWIYTVGASAGGSSDYSSPLYRIRSVFIPFINGKVDGRLIDQHFPVGMFDETVDNPQQHTGRYYRYLANSWHEHSPQPCSTPNCAYERLTGGLVHARGTASDIGGVGSFGDASEVVISKDYTEAQRWAEPKPMRAHAWAPTIALSYDLEHFPFNSVQYGHSFVAAGC